MVSLPTIPTLSCNIGESPVAVVATYAGGLIPISGAKVDFQAGLLFLATTQSTTTNILGLAQSCWGIPREVGAYIQKDGIDFGSGLGVKHYIGNSGFRTAPYMFPKVVAKTLAPGVVIPPPTIIPCVGTITANPPDFSSLLSKLTSPPTSILIPVSVTGSRTSVPMRITVDGIEVGRNSAGYSSFDLINVLNYVGANIFIAHTIKIESTATDCTIQPATFVSPSLRPTGIPTCSQVATTIDSINQPTEITDFNAVFYVYLRGVKEVCKTDPTDPAFIKNLPAGTPGTISIGNLTTTFYLTDNGIADLDLSKLINLQSLITPTQVPTCTPPQVYNPVTGKCETPTRPTGKLNGNVAAAQGYINTYHPGKAVAQVDDPGWENFGSVKIVRSNGTYFHAARLEDISRFM